MNPPSYLFQFHSFGLWSRGAVWRFFAPKDFVMLVVMASYLSLWVTDPKFQVIEFFAGAGRICRLARSLGLSACAHDIAYDNSANSAFNIVRSAGYVFLVICSWFLCFLSVSSLLFLPFLCLYHSHLFLFTRCFSVPFPILIPHLPSAIWGWLFLASWRGLLVTW